MEGRKKRLTSTQSTRIHFGYSPCWWRPLGCWWRHRRHPGLRLATRPHSAWLQPIGGRGWLAPPTARLCRRMAPPPPDASNILWRFSDDSLTILWRFSDLTVDSAPTSFPPPTSPPTPNARMGQQIVNLIVIIINYRGFLFFFLSFDQPKMEAWQSNLWLTFELVGNSGGKTNLAWLFK